MSSGAEQAAAERWLYSVLSGDELLAGLGVVGVHAYTTRETDAMPYILYQYQGGYDVRGVGPARVMAAMLYVVRGVREGPMSGLVAISTRIDNLLQAQSGSNVDGTVIGCVRERPFSLPERVEGRTFSHLGGVYRLWVQ